MRKRNKIIISSLIILIILFSVLYLYPLDKSRKWEDVKMDNGEDSIFTGFTTSEIAENLAIAFDLGPLKSKELETCCGTSQYKYYYKNDASIIITADIPSRSLWPGLSSPIRMHGGKNSYDEITNDPSKTTEFFLNAWKQFLEGLNYQLNDDDYNITYKPWRNNGLNIKIQQVCNNEIPLMNTGIDTYISQENSQINTIEIDEWSHIKIERNISISLDECKNLIENKTPEVSINRSKLNFTGFIYFDENVNYYYKYEIPVEEANNTSGIIHSTGSYVVTENGTKIENEYKGWIEYKFYVNVETGDLELSKYSIYMLIDNR